MCILPRMIRTLARALALACCLAFAAGARAQLLELVTDDVYQPRDLLQAQDNIPPVREIAVVEQLLAFVRGLLAWLIALRVEVQGQK